MPIPEPTPGMWYSLQEAADLCQRRRKTIANLVYKLRLPRKPLRTPNRHRRTYLSADTVRKLQALTLQL